jgi:hypothetical protein
MTANAAVSTNRERIAILWTCLCLFLLRVIGQVEAWLIAPAWLPSMEFWYSGLVPYPVLLPLQIVLLMAMAVIVIDETRGTSFRSARQSQAMRAIALLYFGAMLLRLIVQLLRGTSDALAAGGIPIAFHWVLALFLYELGRSAYLPRSLAHHDGAATRIQTSTVAQPFEVE